MHISKNESENIIVEKKKYSKDIGINSYNVV